MDWNYKHFTQEAVFSASYQDVLEAARAVLAGTFSQIESTSDGFTASGYSAWHAANATVRIESVPEGTKATVELLVERLGMRGYMLFDVAGYYDGQIHKWLRAIAQRLDQQPISISRAPLRQGCLVGCVVYLVAGTCLVLFAIPLDDAVFPQFSDPSTGPFALIASAIGLLAGVLAFVYMAYPEAPISKSIREKLENLRNR